MKVCARNARGGILPQGLVSRQPSHPTSSSGRARFRQLHGYRLTGVLGRGAMGVVYSGRDEHTGAQVALKRSCRRTCSARQTVDLACESALLARLSHPNIVAFIEDFEHEGEHWLVMERIDGQILWEWAKERRPSLAARLAAVIDVGRALMAVHDAALIHCDLKPANIMRSYAGAIKLVDFGLAVSLEKARSPAARARGLGTPGYAAPEQLLGRRLDVRADVFGLCALGFELLHGRPAFVGRDRAELRRRTIAGERSELDSGLSPELSRVFGRGLCPAAHERWPSVRALLAALTMTPEADAINDLYTLLD